jgi:DNA (cytosine-5)-methyltransferase 1
VSEVWLDVCSGEGGGARGLVQAGGYVVGVDINPACREGYLRSGAHEFICADARDVLADLAFVRRFTAITAHPPCQPYSRMTSCRPEIRNRYPRLIAPFRPLLNATGLPWSMENVSGARPHMLDPVTVCMWMFGRPGYRHRLFEAGGGLRLLAPPPPAPDSGRATPSVSVPAGKPNRECGWPHPVPVAKAGHWTPGKFVSVAGHERKAAVYSVMGIDWMSSRDAVKEAIPPYVGYWLATQLASWRAQEQETAA